MFGPVMDARWSNIDAPDMAAVAAAVLRDPGSHGGPIYSVTGPEASGRPALKRGERFALAPLPVVVCVIYTFWAELCAAVLRHGWIDSHAAPPTFWLFCCTWTHTWPVFFFWL